MERQKESPSHKSERQFDASGVCRFTCSIFRASNSSAFASGGAPAVLRPGLRVAKQVKLVKVLGDRGAVHLILTISWSAASALLIGLSASLFVSFFVSLSPSPR
jgi:hypothetical protein